MVNQNMCNKMELFKVAFGHLYDIVGGGFFVCHCFIKATALLVSLAVIMYVGFKWLVKNIKLG